MSQEQLIKAQAIYRESLKPILAESPLGGIGEWVKSGNPPPADDLRTQGLTTDSAVDFQRVRSAFNRNWGMSIPCREVVEALRPLAPLIEVGAGTGYWSALLQAAGLDIICTDLMWEGGGSYGFVYAEHCPTRELGGVEAVEAYPDRNVFCSWPTKDHCWMFATAAVMKSGRILAMIGEPRGGLTGDRDLHTYLSNDFQEIGRVEIPQFPGIADRMTIHRKR